MRARTRPRRCGTTTRRWAWVAAWRRNPAPTTPSPPGGGQGWGRRGIEQALTPALSPPPPPRGGGGGGGPAGDRAGPHPGPLPHAGEGEDGRRSRAGNSGGAIQIINAREHNLKSMTVDIPHNKFSVVTGVSGSG